MSKHLSSGRIAIQAGFSLIEILVTIALITLGLLGVFGLQSKAANIEMESYQRSQALTLARQMEANIRASRSLFAEYSSDLVSSEDGSVYAGVDGNVNCAAPANLAVQTVCEWSDALDGASVTTDGGATRLGAMIGARGCLIRPAVPQANALADIYIVVVWQGITATEDPPEDSHISQCFSGADEGFDAGMRRGLALRVLIPRLQAPA